MLGALLALACRPPAPPPADTVPATGSTGETGVEVPPVPMIGEVLRDRCPTPAAGEPLPLGDSLRAVTLAGIGRCNDGTPPKLYVRAAVDPAHTDDWVWLFDGGNKCLGNEDCAARWCGEVYPFGKRHMSSDPLPPGVGGAGITSLLPENAFAGWNQVFAAYCTSDRWLGAHSDAVLEQEDHPPYRIHFEGSLVALDGIAAGVAGLVSDDGTVALPPLGQARRLVVAGTSAGCQAAGSTTAEFGAAAPSAQLLTLFDSCFDPALEVTDPVIVKTLVDGESRLWDEAIAPVHGAQVAEECAVDHASELWRCTSTDVLARGYLGTVVIHHDQSDPVIYAEFGENGQTKEAFAAMAISTLRLYETDEPQIAAHSNNCGWHTAVDGDGSFLRSTVIDAVHGGPPLSEHDVLAKMLVGERVVVVDSSPPTTSTCNE